MKEKVPNPYSWQKELAWYREEAKLQLKGSALKEINRLLDVVERELSSVHHSRSPPLIGEKKQRG